MNQIQIISASAGSGKTYRLAQLLEQALGGGEVRPEGVLATTFTNKAAAELQERVRVKLLMTRRTGDAQRLSTARIGTVNAVCGRLVGEFAFELGHSPQLKVLDEEAAAFILQHALASVLAGDAERNLGELHDRMPDFFWQDAVREVVNQARSNGLSTEQLRKCADQSRDTYLTLLGDATGTPEELDSQLKTAIETFIDLLDKGSDKTKATASCRQRVEGALSRLEHGIPLPWKEWVALTKLKPGAASREAFEPVLLAAAAQDRHPRLRADISRAIELVFDLASRTLSTYGQLKKERGAIDFIDQETLALHLLGKAEVQEELRHQLDLVLVDEFQDTSPIQLAIFLKLAEIAPRSVWVGDQKQSIYGFRGADPALMDAAISAILADKEPETLAKSYRSRPELVRLTSDLFAPAFELKGIPPQRTRLEPVSESEPGGLGVVMECWQRSAKNQPDDALASAEGIRQMLAAGVQVRDAITEEARQIRAGDIAVLCRTNNSCAQLAEALASVGIASVLPRAGLIFTLEARLVTAGLRLWVDGKDTLAAAELARLITYAGREQDWFAKVLQNPGDAAFGETQEVAAILNVHQTHQHLGALAAYDAVTLALDARTLARRWGNAAARLANLEALRSHAVGYCQACADQGIGCTPAGLLAHLGDLGESQADSQGVFASADAVVLSTLHSAKGLEWPVTVLHDLSRRAHTPLGVHVLSGDDRVDLGNPLAGRWIRYWPNPYASNNNGMPFHERLDDCEATRQATAQADREDLRLLYVGWTRARDRIVLSARQGQLTAGMLELLEGPHGPLTDEPTGPQVNWAGRRVDMELRQLAPATAVESPPMPGEGYQVGVPRDYPPAIVLPSQVPGGGPAATEYERIHDRFACQRQSRLG